MSNNNDWKELEKWDSPNKEKVKVEEYVKEDGLFYYGLYFEMKSFSDIDAAPMFPFQVYSEQDGEMLKPLVLAVAFFLLCQTLQTSKMSVRFVPH